LVAVVAQVLLWVVAAADIQAAPAALQLQLQQLMQAVEADRGSLLMLSQLLPAMDNTKDPEHLAVQA
jgi:hypothetical protein